MIRIKTRSILYKTGLLMSTVMCGMLTVSVWAAILLDDVQLSEQTGLFTELPPIFVAVRDNLAEAKQTQEINYLQIARQRTDEAKKRNIYSTVLTEYQFGKKDADRMITGDQYVVPIKQSKLMTVIESAHHPHTVRITTEDKVIVYLGRDQH